MNINGIIIGAAVFLSIGICHPLVINIINFDKIANSSSITSISMVFSVVRSYEIAEGFVRIQICSS